MANGVERFSNRAEDYERYRQRYPAAEVLGRLEAWCGLRPEWRVADVGAGTGMVSELFLANGNAVTAIEPNAEMREGCERLRERWPELRIVDARAEATGLEDASVEMVAVGRAFHWFDQERALEEFRRVLVPGGWVALLGVGRTEDGSAQIKAFERLLLQAGTDYATVRDGFRVHDRMEAMFPAGMHTEEIRSEQRLSWEELLGQTASLSVAPARKDAMYPAFERTLREFFQEFAEDGGLRVPTSCWITAGQL
jgi:ubiquinone/menaquinone biosynthesis C-methylase UbiE